jgi:glutamine amidotransferase
MQMMAVSSEEGELAGLGWLDAEVVRFNVDQTNCSPLPHMGWNDVSPLEDRTIFKGIASPRYYFLHSYHIRPVNEENILSRTFYGEDFVSAVNRDNVYGTQFHPEKSHQWGIDLLKNFSEITTC